MTQQPTVVDLVTARVVDQFRELVEPRILEAIEDARLSAEHRISEILVSTPVGDPVPVVDQKSDARDRARRTAIQGAISTVVVAVLLAVAGVIGGGGFDYTNLSDWKAVGGAAIGAVLATVTAYVHRLVSPPGETKQ